MDTGDPPVDATWTTPTANRRTRGGSGGGALADLSRQMAVTHLLATPNEGSNHITSSSMMTPAPSPEEMIIRLRGRKSNPITWSPLSINGVQKLAHFEVTPPKDSTPSTRAILGLRSSPRKRLQLNETKDNSTNTTPEKARKLYMQQQQSTSNKRQRLDESHDSVSSLDVSLKGLSREQLIDLIQKMASRHPTIKQDLELSLPEPDLQPIVEELTYLKKNIFKSLPNCRLTSKTDAAAYNKAAVHLAALKRCVMDTSKRLTESEHWNSVIEVTFIAWSTVQSTPVWDNPQHNLVRKQCFRVLATNCLKALKSNKWDPQYKLQVKQRLEHLRGEGDIDACIEYLESSTDVAQ